MADDREDEVPPTDETPSDEAEQANDNVEEADPSEEPSDVDDVAPPQAGDEPANAIDDQADEAHLAEDGEIEDPDASDVAEDVELEAGEVDDAEANEVDDAEAEAEAAEADDADEEAEEATQPATDDDPVAAPVAEPTENTPPRWTQWAAPALAILLLGVVGLALVLQDTHRNQQVPEADWEAAADDLRAGYEPGDVVRVEPVWSDTPRVFLPGATFDLTPTPRRDILDQYERVWVLAGFNRGGDVQQVMPDAYDLVYETTFGDVDLLRYDIPAAARPIFDFQKNVATARVRRHGPKRTQDCSIWRDDAWHCGRVDRFLHVRANMRDMDNEPRYCVYLPAVPGNAWHEITFPKVELHQRITGRVGMDNRAVRSERGGDADFEVLFNQQSRFETVLDPRDPTFHPFELDTSEWAGRKVDVTYRVRAADFYDRFVCFTAQIPAE